MLTKEEFNGLVKGDKLLLSEACGFVKKGIVTFDSFINYHNYCTVGHPIYIDVPTNVWGNLDLDRISISLKYVTLYYDSICLGGE